MWNQSALYKSYIVKFAMQRINGRVGRTKPIINMHMRYLHM